MRFPAICERTGLNSGTWAAEEDETLSSYVKRHGHWNWSKLPKHAGLNRSGKSCRLRWLNYLRPDLKRGSFTADEEELVHNLHQQFGNSWSRIAASLPGRSDNEIKNYWHTKRKNRTAPTKAPKKAKSVLKSLLPEYVAPVILDTSGSGLVRQLQSRDSGNGVVVMKDPIADGRSTEVDKTAWSDSVELESMLDTIIQKCHGENDFESDPGYNATQVLDSPVSTPIPESIFSAFAASDEVLITRNQATEETAAEHNYWNEMLLPSQNLDMAFVLAEAWLIPPLHLPGEVLYEYQ